MLPDPSIIGAAPARRLPLATLLAIACLALPGGALLAQDDAPATAPAVADAVWEQLDSPRSAERVEAVRTLLAAGRTVLPGLREHLAGHPSDRVRAACVDVLVELAPPGTLALLVDALGDESLGVSERARAGILRLFQPGMGDRLRALADARRERGVVDDTLHRLLYLFRLRELLAECAVWRTQRTPWGLRFVNQYAAVADDPEAAATLIRFLGDRDIAPEELGPEWEIGDASLAAVRALGDAGVREATGVLTDMLERRGMTPQRMYLRRQATPLGRGDAMTLLQVLVLVQHRLGAAPRLADQIARYESSLVQQPHPQTAFFMATVYAELGDERRFHWALRVAARGAAAASLGYPMGELPLIWMHLSAMTLRLAVDPAAFDPMPVGDLPDNPGMPFGPNPQPDTDEEEPPDLDEPASVGLALEQLKTALEVGFSDPRWLQVDSRFDAMREEPRFVRYLDHLARIFPDQSR